MQTDDFEQELRQQAMRETPATWRAEILAAARAGRQPGWFSTFNRRLSTILWPSPRAWGALAATWLAIFVVQFSVKEKPTTTREATVLVSTEVKAALQQQRRMLAELIDWPKSSESERRHPGLDRPRSERFEARLNA